MFVHRALVRGAGESSLPEGIQIVKNRRNESVFATGALVLMLSLTLFYGCRAFDPEPVVVNLPPDTFVIGGPGEDTGTGFRRHLYWYGTDRDGDVVQFIYAITDTSVRDEDDPTTDEEDRRFNPVEDITTVTENEGFVGWTTKTDSVFIFTIDREFLPSKEITFHIVSVDDRGAIDPTPARLRFFNNAAGNPRVRFRVYAEVDEVTGEGGELRWVGDPSGPDADSPEQTSDPFVGFQQPFRIEWEASTPNQTLEFEDPIIGYRYKARQGAGFPFTPDVDSLDNKLFGDTQSFFYANNTPGENLEGNCNTNNGVGCDPTVFRWPSGAFTLSVETLDRALVQNRPEFGQLTFQVNYPPQTAIEPVAQYVVRDQSGAVLDEGGFRRGDRIPYGSEVTFVSRGFDRFPQTLPDSVSQDRLCCDEPFEFDPNDPDNPDNPPEVRFTERVAVVRQADFDEDPLPFQTSSGVPLPSGTVSFVVAPYDYTYISTTVDELGRFDDEPATFDFSVGYTPSLVPELAIPNPALDKDRLVVGITGLVEDDSLLTRIDPFVTAYLVQDSVEPTCGARLVFDESTIRPDEVSTSFTGRRYTYGPRLVARNDPRDPLGVVRAWSYSLNSVNDPDNSIEDGAESSDLKFFISGTSPNVLDFGEEPVVSTPERELSFFVPFDLFNRDSARAFDADSDDEQSRQLGCLLIQRLGEMELRYRGRVTPPEAGDFPFFANRNEEGESTFLPENIAPYGAKTSAADTRFFLYVGVETNNDGVIDPSLGERFWPDEIALEGVK